MSDCEEERGYNTDCENYEQYVIPSSILGELVQSPPRGLPDYNDTLRGGDPITKAIEGRVPTMFEYHVLLKQFHAEETRNECPDGSNNHNIITGLCSGWATHSTFSLTYGNHFKLAYDDCPLPEVVSKWKKSRENAQKLFWTFATEPISVVTELVKEDYELLKVHVPDVASQRLKSFLEFLPTKINEIHHTLTEGLLFEFLVFMKDLCSKLAADGQAAGGSPSDVAPVINGAAGGPPSGRATAPSGGADVGPQVGDKRCFKDTVEEFIDLTGDD